MQIVNLVIFKWRVFLEIRIKYKSIHEFLMKIPKKRGKKVKDDSLTLIALAYPYFMKLKKGPQICLFNSLIN